MCVCWFWWAYAYIRKNMVRLTLCDTNSNQSNYKPNKVHTRNKKKTIINQMKETRQKLWSGWNIFVWQTPFGCVRNDFFSSSMFNDNTGAHIVNKSNIKVIFCLLRVFAPKRRRRRRKESEREIKPLFDHSHSKYTFIIGFVHIVHGASQTLHLKQPHHSKWISQLIEVNKPQAFLFIRRYTPWKNFVLPSALPLLSLSVLWALRRDAVIFHCCAVR